VLNFSFLLRNLDRKELYLALASALPTQEKNLAIARLALVYKVCCFVRTVDLLVFSYSLVTRAAKVKLTASVTVSR